ncbi:SET domain-containing protein 5 [Zalerion maritima]|uniref:SET domain-containing protein 5 n=1 Tax=Zalerion maritima TaxID=339359 RepID=A0AAD5WNZ5_9PEZI|nr:SET domain-containing protein 5 [Zalerion maritima]
MQSIKGGYTLCKRIGLLPTSIPPKSLFSRLSMYNGRHDEKKGTHITGGDGEGVVSIQQWIEQEVIREGRISHHAPRNSGPQKAVNRTSILPQLPYFASSSPSTPPAHSPTDPRGFANLNASLFSSKSNPFCNQHSNDGLVEEVSSVAGVGPLSAIKVRPSPGKGMGVFAMESISQDAVIMRDRLAFRIFPDEDDSERYRRFSNLSATAREDILKLSVHGHFGLHMSSLKGLVSSEVPPELVFKMMQLNDILITNGFGLIMNEMDGPAGLFLNASRINHSCVSNADVTCHSGSHDLVVLANRDIGRGEEITIRYDYNFLPRDDRQARLLDRGFLCRCPVCDLNNPESSAFEELLMDLRELCLDPCLDTAGRLIVGERWPYKVLDDASWRAQRRIKIYTGHHALRMCCWEAYQGAFDIAIAQYKLRPLRITLKRAIRLLELIMEQDMRNRGENSDITQENKKLYARLQRGDIP